MLGARRPPAARGHQVYTPTLAGLGERTHLLDPRIDLETHARDVVDVLAGEDLTGVILVGHSYGGMVITGVAEQAPDRLARLVFLDAFVPEDGQALFDLLRPERRDSYRQKAQAQGDGWRVPPPPSQALGVTDEEHCTTGPLVPSFAPFAARLRATPGWRYHELATGHDAMLTAPEELAEVLLKLNQEQDAGREMANGNVVVAQPRGHQSSKEAR